MVPKGGGGWWKVGSSDPSKFVKPIMLLYFTGIIDTGWRMFYQ